MIKEVTMFGLGAAELVIIVAYILLVCGGIFGLIFLIKYLANLRPPVDVVQKGATRTVVLDSARASEEDRERTISMLKEEVALGRLTFGDFEQRIENAHVAETVGDLDRLTNDLS